MTIDPRPDLRVGYELTDLARGRLSTATCPDSLSGDHAWPAWLDQDAQCLVCGLWYAEYCTSIGEVFTIPEPEPDHEPDLLAEIDAYEYADVPEWTLS